MQKRNDKKTVLITGATGMVGGFVLQYLLTDSRVGTVVSIGRRKTGLEDLKLQEIVHDDFLDFSGMKDNLLGIDACFYCLGVYQPHVTKDEFFTITCDYQKALTDVLQKTSPKATFVLFGASGADPTEQSNVTFAKGKGRAENLLNQTVFPEKYIFRPGYIHPTGSRRPAGFLYKLLLPIGALMFKLFPSTGIADRDLAKAMVNVGLAGKRKSRVFSNQETKEFI